MPDIIAPVAKAPSVLLAFIKAHWGIFLGVVIGVAVLAMAKKSTIIGWFTSTGGQSGDRLPLSVRKFLGVAAVLILGGGTLLWSGDAYAATCCAAAAAAHASTGALGFLAAHWHYLAGAAGSLAFGLTQFTAPDVIDCVETHGGASLNVPHPLPATTVKALYCRTSTHSTTPSGAPLVATDITVEIATKVKNLTTGDAAIEDDDLARILAFLQIESPIMGSLTDQLSCTGPVLDLVTRFIGDAFERSGDAPVASITIGAPGDNEVSVTKYFTKPLALRFLDRPLTTAPWIGLLHDTALNIGLAADSCLGDVSTGATVSGDRLLKASISYLPVPHWYYPMLAYDRVDAPASGSNGLTFKNFGGPGPKCTVPVDYVHTIGQLSSLKGLPGNLTFDTLTKLLAPRFGLDAVENIPHLVKSRIRAQYYGHIGGVDYASSGNYAAGTANDPGMALASLLFFLLQQPSLDMAPANMRPMGGADELPLQYTTSAPRTGPDAFYFGALRKVNASVISDWRRLPKSGLPAAIGETVHFATGK
jgi:hypothetical protein